MYSKCGTSLLIFSGFKFIQNMLIRRTAAQHMYLSVIDTIILGSRGILVIDHMQGVSAISELTVSH